MEQYQDQSPQEKLSIEAPPAGSPDVSIQGRSVSRMSRRNFLAASGTVAAVSITACGGNDTTTPTPTPTPTATPSPAVTELAVLNFALNLEYLEATFYAYIATGSGLSAAEVGSSPGAVTNPPAKITFTDPNVAALAQQLASDELAHVQFLRSLITAATGTPVSLPALNLSALGAVVDDNSFLAITRQLETVGTSAYEGGISAFVSDTAGLAYAATIHDTEGQHEGTLRQFCIAKGITSAAVDANDKPPTTSAVFNTNAMGLNTSRTTSQVLQIVYAAAGKTGVSSGGFYPSGMNGTIVSS